MLIIVLQKFEANTEDIQARVAQINPDVAQQIKFFNVPADALDLVRRTLVSEKIFMVSGNVFGTTDAGHLIAQVAKKRRPDILFFLYSTEPSPSPYFDGIIRKRFWGDGDDLPRILCEINDESTVESIRKAFPDIRDGYSDTPK